MSTLDLFIITILFKFEHGQAICNRSIELLVPPMGEPLWVGAGVALLAVVRLTSAFAAISGFGLRQLRSFDKQAMTVPRTQTTEAGNL